MTAIELVRSFYNSDLANDASVVSKYFDKDSELHWTSSQGFMLLTYDDIVNFFKGTRKSYTNLRFEFTHFIESGDTVITRHTLLAKTIENPELEQILAHFSTIWEVKNGKLYRGYEISHQADENDSMSIKSYTERNI